jgi:hypothetical protein
MSIQEPFPSPQALPMPPDDDVSTIQLIERGVNSHNQNVFIRLWYHLAAPKEPDASANLMQREAYRHGQMVSIVLLVLMLILLVGLLTVVGLFVNSTLPPILIGSLFALFGAMLLNRGGHILLAGIIVVLVDGLAIAIAILNSPGGIGPYHLPILDMFIQGDILAIILLPAEWVFAVAALYISFIVSVLTWLPVPRTSELTILLHSPLLGGIIARPVGVQVFVAAALYLWARNVRRSLQRANRAATIATFEHSLSEQALLETEQRRYLDQSMQMIIDTLPQFANNKRSVRIPLEQIDQQLWEVASSLNDQFARAQNLSQAETQLERTHKAAQHFLAETQRAPSLPVFWQTTGTVIDAVAKDYNARLSNKQTH